MSFDFFNARWSRIFADAGLPVKGTETVFFPIVERHWDAATRAVLGFAKTDPNFQGTRAVSAVHLRLDHLFKNISPIEAYAYVPRSTQEVAAALIERYGVPLKAEWFVDAPITDEQVNNMPFDIKLQLKNVPWCSHNTSAYDITVTVYEPNADIADVFKTDILDMPVMPYTIRAGKTNLELITVGVDFTPLYPDDYTRLLEIETSEDLFSAATPHIYRADVLVRLMQERTGITTVRTPTGGDITTNGATLVFNGKASQYPSADTRYDRVIVMDITCDKYAGRYYFHYNDLY